MLMDLISNSVTTSYSDFNELEEEGHGEGERDSGIGGEGEEGSWRLEGGGGDGGGDGDGESRSLLRRETETVPDEKALQRLRLKVVCCQRGNQAFPTSARRTRIRPLHIPSARADHLCMRAPGLSTGECTMLKVQAIVLSEFVAKVSAYSSVLFAHEPLRFRIAGIDFTGLLNLFAVFQRE
ncbi:hypothetical protein M0802_013737 [Mischocyttarus mexicanus]|nr:hypothetical protein M0802_013737 [Mischocyttarus mexicanus]